MTKLTIPHFESESEEAQWWFENRALVSNELVNASQQGRTGEGSKARQERKMSEALEKQAAA